MTSGLWIYHERRPFAGIQFPERNLELTIRVFLLACELGYEAVLSMPAQHDIEDERIEAMRWRGHPIFASPAWRALLEEVERREKEGRP